MTACRDNDTLVVTKLDWLARSLPAARAILEELTARQVKLNLGGSVHEYADIISIAGALQITEQPPGTRRIATDAADRASIRPRWFTGSDALRRWLKQPAGHVGPVDWLS
jgi:hypothetical protein